MSLHPQSGARFLLERGRVDDGDARAEYAAAIYTPEARFDYRVTLGLDGSFEVEPDADAADEALEKKLTMIARLTARSAARKRDDGLPPWPHRVLRWKGPGRG